MPTKRRHRYIAFEPPTPRPSRHAFNEQIGPRSWRLTVYEDDVGILQTPHTDAKDARDALENLGAEPITTSGTILQAKKRSGIA